MLTANQALEITLKNKPPRDIFKDIQNAAKSGQGSIMLTLTKDEAKLLRSMGYRTMWICGEFYDVVWEK